MSGLVSAIEDEWKSYGLFSCSPQLACMRSLSFSPDIPGRTRKTRKSVVLSLVIESLREESANAIIHKCVGYRPIKSTCHLQIEHFLDKNDA